MNAFLKLGKDHRIGKLCKYAAWVVVVAGVLQISLTLYALWGVYRQMQMQPADQPFAAANQINELILYGGTQVFTDIITTLTFALLLYAIGAVITTLSVPEKEESEVTFENLDEEEASSSNEQVAHT
ncbi:MAG: hypothetical protein M3Z24_15485 [Chloroflexota bacterium]|nr:hypothetical protein [Chloroflexota bacterium]